MLYQICNCKKCKPRNEGCPIIDGKSADIETIDNNILMETVGVAMAIGNLRESLDKVESHLDHREFEKASHD